MNYSKKGTIEKQKQLHSSSKKIVKKASVSIFRIILILVFSIIIVGSVSAYGMMKGLIDNAPSIEDINVIPTGYATFIYDTDGKITQRLVGSSANRIYAKNDEIPKYVKEAFIAIEDERFYEHKGIDVRGILRAFVNGITSGDFDQGASTLTQQLLKNQVFNGGNETTFTSKLQRKIQEQYLAVKLEEHYSKDQILEYYLNTINLGANTLGVQAASQRYFNKKVSDLTLSESAVIASITQNPTYLNPITYPEANEKRRAEVLKKMKEQGKISDAEYKEALADNVYERIQETNIEYSSNTTYNSYFVDELIEQVTADLQDKLGYTSTQASNMIYKGGLKIYTTQDSSLQSTVDKILQDESLYPKDSQYELEYRLSIQRKNGDQEHFSELTLKKYFYDLDKENGVPTSKRFNLYFKSKESATPYIEEYKKHVLKDGDEIIAEKINYKLQPQISFTLMDQHTGEIKALVGGRGEKTGNRTLNRATNTLRQPGSTFKVLSTYLPALDTAGMTLATVQDDAEFYYPGTNRKVNNWNHKYKGLTTLRDGIVHSMNVISVKTLNDITPQIGFDYLKNLGFTSLVDQRVNKDGSVNSDINLSLALGGITDGVSNLELTAAYAAIANSGVYTKPVFYTKIEDQNGNVLLENTPETKQVMKESTAWLLTDAMRDVVKVGTGKLTRFSKSNMPVAGKTGTTSNDIDLWFTGYTPYYTATIWGGYDYGVNQSNTQYHKKLWKAVMDEIHSELTVKNFSKPDNITSAKICTKSGKLAIEGVCDHALGGSTVRTEYFAKGTVPTEKCNVHIKLKICTESGELATEYCPPSSIKEVVYLLKDETSKTADSQFIMPNGLDTTSCHIHKHGFIDTPKLPTPGPSSPLESSPPHEDPPHEKPPHEKPPHIKPIHPDPGNDGNPKPIPLPTKKPHHYE